MALGDYVRGTVSGGAGTIGNPEVTGIVIAETNEGSRIIFSRGRSAGSALIRTPILVAGVESRMAGDEWNRIIPVASTRFRAANQADLSATNAAVQAAFTRSTAAPAVERPSAERTAAGVARATRGASSPTSAGTGNS